MRGEFETIAACFAGLAAAVPGAFGLRNDGAVIDLPPSQQLTITLDTLIEGVHFLAEDPPEDVARKLLRVNLSDLAAMGARPLYYALSTAFAKGTAESWIDGFAGGLARDQAEFSVSLIGGDTVATPGPPTFTLCAFGGVASGQALRRDGARAGDRVFVSGTLGDGALGLLALRGGLPGLDPAHLRYLGERYRLPSPRVALGQALVGLASACLDVSDGLLADLGHLAEESGLGVVVDCASLPLSSAATAVLSEEVTLLERVVAGGDDYELAFTVPAERAGQVVELAAQLELPLTAIGRMVPEPGVSLRDRDGAPLELTSRGWTHF